MVGLNILLVEDNSSWQIILQNKISRALQNLGRTDYTIKVVEYFDEASRILQENIWDLLVTDIKLRDSSAKNREKLGTQLVPIAQKNKIPAIAVTGTSILITEEDEKLLENEASEVFRKNNFDSEKFMNKVEMLLQK